MLSPVSFGAMATSELRAVLERLAEQGRQLRTISSRFHRSPSQYARDEFASLDLKGDIGDLALTQAVRIADVHTRYIGREARRLVQGFVD